MTDKQIHVTVIPEQERINVVFGHGVHETQADWNQQDAAASDYIKNKPPETTAGEGITITDGVVSIDTESEIWENKQDALTFGDGLDLNEGELSVDISEVISAGDGVTINNGEISIDTSDAQDGEILFAIAEEVNGETKLVVHWGVPPTGNYVDLANLPKINGVTLVGNKSTADLLIPVYTDMIGATASTAGTSGLVPAPAAGDNTRFLRGDGSWQDVPHQDTTYTAGANINIDANNNNAISVSSGNAANTQFLKSDGNGGAVWTGALVRSVNNRTGDLIMYPQMGSGANALFFSPQMAPSDASGDYSEAHGYQTKSAGSGSVTFGYKTKTGANAAYAEAHGSQTTASGNYSAAFGGGTTASGANSFAIGEDTIASGVDSFAIGYRTRATGNRSIAGGNQAEAGHSSIAIGDGTIATGDCSAGFGIYNGASGNYSLVSGIHSTATGTASVALGHTATASNTGAVALGRSTQATGQNSFAAGYGGVASALGSVALSGGSATSNYAVAIGKGANATAANSFAIGHTITADQDYSTIVGYYGKTPTNALFSVANGVHDYATAFNIFKNGDIAAGSNWTPTADNHLATKKYVDDNAGGGVQSDWDITDNTSPAFIKNKPDLSVYAQSANLATVATTGDYDDLLNKPTIPTVPVTDVQVNGTSVVSSGVASVSVPDISGCEVTTNKVTALSVASTDTQYPSAKCVYDELTAKQNTLTAGTGISIVGDTISATGGSIPSGTANGDLLVWDNDNSVWTTKPYWQIIYQPVEYIESSGTQRIDTGVPITTDLKMVLERANVNTNECIEGVINSSPSVSFSWGTLGNNGNYKSLVGNVLSTWADSGVTVNTNKHTVEIESGSQKLDGVQYGTQVITAYNKNIGLFSWNGSGSWTDYSSRLYSCKFYKSGVLIRDFIPCYNVFTGEVGLLDKANYKFYSNAGTGTFTKGADV